MCNVIGFHRPAIDFDKLIFIIRSSTVKANLPNEDKIDAKIAGSYVSTVVFNFKELINILTMLVTVFMLFINAKRK